MMRIFLTLLLATTALAQNYTISTLAGWSGNSYVARINNGPIFVAVDGSGNVYCASADGYLYKITPGLVPSRIARVNGASMIAADGAGTIYVGDAVANQVLKISPDGALRSVLFSGLKSLSGLAVDIFGTIYVSDSTLNLIYRLPLGAAVPQVIAGVPGSNGPNSGDGGPALRARLNQPAALALDAIGSLYFLEFNSSYIRKISPGGIITIVAGNGTAGHTGDGGPGTQAQSSPAHWARTIPATFISANRRSTTTCVAWTAMASSRPLPVSRTASCPKPVITFPL